MITITNGQMTLTVPNSAYMAMYKNSGFRPLEHEEDIVEESDTFITPDEENTSTQFYDEENEDLEEAENEEEEEIDLSEIPLSEMDFYQLCDYADQLGLDRKGIRSKKELRALIKDNI